MSTEQLKRGKLLGANQDGNREWISLLATICTDRTALPPAIIYQSDSGDLQESWLQDFDNSQHVYFSGTSSGWTNDELGLSWLQRVFDRNTKEKAGNRRRLLLVDGHSSHINMKFINYCDKNKIILVILLPYSTHRL